MSKVVTGKVRASYANVDEPKSINGSAEKYSCSFIVSKDDEKTVSAIKAAIEEAKQEGKAKFGGKIPAVLKTPLRDGDVERPEDPAYKNAYFINANSKDKPQLVDRNVRPILEPNTVYSGCYVRASLSFYAFNTNGNKGIACGLGNIQKLEDGPSLGGRSRAEDEFTTAADDDFLS